MPKFVPGVEGGSPRSFARVDRVRWSVAVSFESHGVRFGVRSNDEGLVDRLPALLPPGARRARARPDLPTFSLWVPRSRPARPTRVYAGTRRRARTLVLDDALAVLESEIRQAVAARARRHTFVHAGVVGWHGRALVIPGRSRAGKTTLVAQLVKAGATYLSDEFAVLDAHGRAHPFAKRLSIRGPGGCDRHAARPSAEELGGRSERAPLPVGMVVVTEFQPGVAWSERRLTPGQSVLELLAHTVAARQRPELSLASLSQAVSGAIVFKGPRGEAEELAPRLIEAAERTWGAAGRACGGRTS